MSLFIILFKFYIWLNNSLWHVEENLVMNNKDSRMFISRTIVLIVAPWKFDVLKTSIFAFKAN